MKNKKTLTVILSLLSLTLGTVFIVMPIIYFFFDPTILPLLGWLVIIPATIALSMCLFLEIRDMIFPHSRKRVEKPMMVMMPVTQAITTPIKLS